jgi:hypothetical protein
MKHFLLICAFSLLFHPVQAVINFGGDNTYNITDPGTGVPWDAVARVASWDGVSFTSPAGSGSAIHLGNGYMITAHHVSLFNSVTFDGTTPYTRDTSFTPQQVAPGVDMKIFKLATTPTTSSVNLYTGTSEVGQTATLVGFGVGRDPATPINSTSVPWGTNATIDKRWGRNVIETNATVSYSVSANSYPNNSALITALGESGGTPPGLGANEASVTLRDSGSGLFINISGTWYLSGLTTIASNPTVFGDDLVTDLTTQTNWNGFIRISEYEDDIQTLIPEPGAFALLSGAAFGAFVLVRRRQRSFICPGTNEGSGTSPSVTARN